MKHTPRLALACLLSVATLQSAAQIGPEIVLTPPKSQGNVEIDLGTFFAPTEADVTGADVDLSIYDARGRVLFRPPSGPSATPKAPFIDVVGFEYTQFDIDTTDAALPDRLFDVAVAVGGGLGDYGSRDPEAKGYADGTWKTGYTLGIGYAGTAPFNDGDAWYGLANLFAFKPIDRDTRWLVGLNYDGNRVFLPDVPLPVVTYFSRLNENVVYGIGLPFSSLTWTPTDRWTIDLRSAVFFSITGRATYDVTDDLSLFASFVRRSEAFTVSGGADHRRLLFTQQRVELGLNYDLGAGVSLTVAGGWAFDQEFDVGFDSRDPAGLRDLDDSGYIRVGIDLRF